MLLTLNSENWGDHRPSLLVSIIILFSRETLLGRGIARRQISQILKSLHPRPFDVWLWGSRVRLHAHQNPTEMKALLRPDLLDQAELSLLRSIVQAPESTFVDVGANSGLYSLHAALNAGLGTRILAIEPDGRIVSRLQRNLLLAKQDGQIGPNVHVDIAETAAGDFNGTATLASDGQEGARAIVQGEGLSVKMQTLPAILNDFGFTRIEILKIDVEGYEDKVLVALFQEQYRHLWPRVVIMEHVSRAEWRVDCFDLLAGVGYYKVGASRSNTMLRRD